MSSSSGDLFTRLSWFRRDRVSRAKVMVVGCGALGNEVVKSLAMFGVGTLVVVDFDSVEQSNLSRSVLFDGDDARREVLKVEAIQRSVERLNPDVRVVPIVGDIATHVGLALIREMDVIIGCVDNRWARYCINRLAFRADVPWVDGGIEGLEGTARLFEFGYNCYGCNLGEHGLREMSRRVSCSQIISYNREHRRVATTPIVASIIGAVQAQEAMKVIHRDVVDEGQFTTLRGKMFYYEGEHLTTRIVEFEGYDDDCPLHERWDNIVMSDLSAAQSVGEVLSELRRILGCEDVVIELLNHTFVEYIETKSGGERRRVMLPSYMVESFVEHDSDLSGELSSQIYQREWREIGADFPFCELTLRDLGVPFWDVLQVSSGRGVDHVELGADRCKIL